jgi:hypothetical protein
LLIIGVNVSYIIIAQHSAKRFVLAKGFANEIKALIKIIVKGKPE